MRNILITVMMLIVCALLFTAIVSGEGGLQEKIKEKGDIANSRIEGLDTDWPNP